MSIGFRAVQWNRDKIVYDAILIVCVVVFIAAFVIIHNQWHPPKNVPDAIDAWIEALRAFDTFPTSEAADRLAFAHRRIASSIPTIELEKE